MSADWRAQARCTAKTAHLFDELAETDPRQGRSVKVPPRILAAIAICDTCPVRTACLEAAFDHHDSGVRAGLYLRAGRIDHDMTDRADLQRFEAVAQ